MGQGKQERLEKRQPAARKKEIIGIVTMTATFIVSAVSAVTGIAIEIIALQTAPPRNDGNKTSFAAG